ncbi:C40 family peptidase [Streptomyces griseoflavus]|uniref:C40 family peptidase n=1 Tax=Streptomyces griseoflavus TaxID=35619 RepID=UPI00167E3C48|nr:C40 family peptidase [Streptomyces griseoflavus]GGV15271.1 hypothetical protein GCM10010293_07990 [Streptomyces griseoflavus]
MGSHRRTAPSSGSDRSAVVALGLLSAAATALGAAPAAAAPPDDTRAADVDRLYEEAERATEAYNAADERADGLRRQISAAQDGIARKQQRVNAMRESLGSLAGAQYRSGGLEPALALLLSDDPEDYLEKASVLDRITVHQAGELRHLRGALRSLAQDRAEAAGKFGALDRSRKAAAAHKRTVERKLAEARRLLDSLPAGERAAWDRAGRSARADLPGPGAAAASGRAAAAVAAARSALGRPYVWGANGPSGFDCSGLTQWSYAQAGVALPRTSQAQRYAGRQVPLSEARPGDLVLYRSDASHVGMYMGNGQVIHAPYPGAPVRYDPVGMMPVSSVTRV